MYCIFVYYICHVYFNNIYFFSILFCLVFLCITFNIQYLLFLFNIFTLIFAVMTLLSIKPSKYEVYCTKYAHLQGIQTFARHLLEKMANWESVFFLIHKKMQKSKKLGGNTANIDIRFQFLFCF